MKTLLLSLLISITGFPQDSLKKDTLIHFVMYKLPNSEIRLEYHESENKISQQTMRAYLLFFLKDLYLKPKEIILDKKIPDTDDRD